MSRRRTALTAGLLALLLSASPAAAYSRGKGRSGDAPGQGRAVENCDSQVLDQKRRGVVAKGGPKRPNEEGSEAPANCDHYWQNDGYIGNG